MSKNLYKQYVLLVRRWPKDEFKGTERNLASFLNQEVERQFKSEMTASDVRLCERRYRALEQIDANNTAKVYPHQYRSGIFGLTLEQLQEVNTDDNRKRFGLGREGFLKRIWKAVL
ncbi:hypothetical protein Angca_002177, partial [Angiostrongylus cantonensis]